MQIQSMHAIIENRARPVIEYASARTKDGNNDSKFAKWSMKHFNDIMKDRDEWQSNYSNVMDAIFTKIYVFYRIHKTRFIFFGRYTAEKFDGNVLTLKPIHNSTVVVSESNMNLLANASAHLHNMIGSPIPSRVRSLIDTEE